jgi:hypothetical protein
LDHFSVVNLTSVERLLFIRGLLFLLSSLEPGHELLGTLANLSARAYIHILLASLGAPGFEDFLRDQVIVVVLDEDSRDLSNQLGLFLAHEALGTSEECFLMAFRVDELLEHGSTRLDLLDNVVGEQGLSENSESSVLGLNAKLLGLEIDVDVVHLVDITLFLGRLDHPAAKYIVDVVVTSVVLLAIKDQSALEIIRQILGTGFDGGL